MKIKFIKSKRISVFFIASMNITCGCDVDYSNSDWIIGQFQT